MRLLHTSDWHLGRTLHRADLADAQAAFLDHLVETVRAERVDAVLVAGDVYDRAVPPVGAVQMYDEALARLSELAQVVVIPGNHDSAVRLGVGGPVMARGGVHLRTEVPRLAEPVTLADEHGPVQVFGIPYLEPEAVRTSLPADPAGGTEDPRGHVGVLGRAMDCIRAERTGPRSVVLAHAWVQGGAESESERDITVGGTSRVPTTLFDGVTYTALGHLHRPQVLEAGLRYSGSPLAYSFSEAGYTKGSWLIDLDATGIAAVELVPAPVPRRLVTLTGTLDELLTDPALAEHEGAWVRARLTDTARPEDAHARLEARFGERSVLVLDWKRQGADSDGTAYAERVARRGDQEVTEAFLEHVRGAAASEDEQALIGQAIQESRVARGEQAPARVPEQVST